MAGRALLVMDDRKPYETPKWWPGNAESEAMCCSYCGGRDHNYEHCPKVAALPVTPDNPDANLNRRRG
jgi:hypothetical protein